MKNTLKSLGLTLVLTASALAISNGQKVPAFTLMSDSGKKVSLSQYEGKIVVLEWLNHGCPFVKKHYDSNNMQKLQKNYTDQDVVWLSVISSAEEKQGYSDAKKAKSDKKAKGSHATAILLDPSGEVGRFMGAKTTPHFFILNKKGEVAYKGAIDSIPSTDIEDVAKAENYVAMALDSLIKGKEITKPTTKPYGCSVKY